MKHLPLIAIIALLGGGVPVFGKSALQEIPVFTFIFLSLILSLVILTPSYLKKEKKKRSKKDFILLVSLSLLPMINFVLFAFGIQKTYAGFAQAISTLSPIFALLFSFLFSRETFP